MTALFASSAALAEPVSSDDIEKIHVNYNNPSPEILLKVYNNADKYIELDTGLLVENPSQKDLYNVYEIALNSNLLELIIESNSYNVLEEESFESPESKNEPSLIENYDVSNKSILTECQTATRECLQSVTGMGLTCAASFTKFGVLNTIAAAFGSSCPELMLNGNGPARCVHANEVCDYPYIPLTSTPSPFVGYNGGSYKTITTTCGSDGYVKSMYMYWGNKPGYSTPKISRIHMYCTGGKKMVFGTHKGNSGGGLGKNCTNISGTLVQGIKAKWGRIDGYLDKIKVSCDPTWDTTTSDSTSGWIGGGSSSDSRTGSALCSEGKYVVGAKVRRDNIPGYSNLNYIRGLDFICQ